MLGAGAIGGVLAAALGDAGRSVTLCDRIGFDVLERTFEGETRRYHHPVMTSPEGLDPVDWLLLCTKAHQVPGASSWLDRLIGPDTRVGVIQNGVDSTGKLKQQAVAGGIGDAASMFGNQRIDELISMSAQRSQGAFLVLTDQARIAGDVGGNNGRQSAVFALQGFTSLEGYCSSIERESQRG